MRKKVQLISLGGIALVVLYMVTPPLYEKYFSGENLKKEEGTTPVKGKQKILNVKAEIVHAEELKEKIVSVGNILPDETVELSFETSGKIVEIDFKEGSYVKQGELLARINDAPLQAQLKKLESQVPLAESRVFRQKTLLEKDAVSQETYEKVSTELATLKAEIDMVKAQIDQTRLKAPFDGYIGLRQMSEGQYASPNTVVAKMSKVSPVKIEFSVPERYAMQVKQGTPIRFFLVGTNKAYEAQVYAMDAEINLSTRTRTGRALFQNEKSEVVPGAYTSVEIDLSHVETTIAIPSEALIPEMGIDKVFVYKNGKSEPRVVKTGLRTESKVQILEGLALGDTLIVNGVLQLRQGLPVIIEQIER